MNEKENYFTNNLNWCNLNLINVIKRRRKSDVQLMFILHLSDRTRTAKSQYLIHLKTLLFFYDNQYFYQYLNATSVPHQAFRCHGNQTMWQFYNPTLVGGLMIIELQMQFYKFHKMQVEHQLTQFSAGQNRSIVQTISQFIF